MNGTKKHLTYLLTGLIVVSISGCGAPNNHSNNATPANQQTPTTKNQVQSQPDSSAKSSTQKTNTSEKAEKQALQNTDPNSATVTIYHVDNQCAEFVPKKVAVPKNNTLNAAIGKVIEKGTSSDFNVAGYRVKVNNNVATVDLRLAANSKRKFVSLSSCEQYALFGSLRKTIAENPQWNVKEVVFTEQGQEIVF